MTRSIKIASAVLLGSLFVMSPLALWAGHRHPQLAKASDASKKKHKGTYVKSVGVRVAEVGGLFAVVYVKPGSPADLAGIKEDENIFQVDAQQTLGLSARKVAKLLKGDAGTTVSVKIGRLLNDTRVVQITRQ